MDREWKTKRQKPTLFSCESKTLFIVFTSVRCFYRFTTNGKHHNSSLFVLHSSLYLVSSSAQSVVEVHDSLHLVEVVSNL